jgi:hypothetical protein
MEKRPRLRDYPEAIRTALCMHEMMRRLNVAMSEVHTQSDGENTSVVYCGGVFSCGALGYGGEEFAQLWDAAAQHWNEKGRRMDHEREGLWLDFVESLVDIDRLTAAILNAPKAAALAAYNQGES